MKVDESSIKNVLSAMSESIGKENVELYKKLIEEKGFKKDLTDIEEFYFGLIYPFEQFLQGLIQCEISRNREVQFLILHSQFVERQFNKLFVDVEGSACSADKSRTIIRRLFLWLNEGKRIEWDYKGEYTFHLPKKIFTTHDEIVEFYKGIENLYYGNYKLYLEALKKILSKIEKEKNENNN